MRDPSLRRALSWSARSRTAHDSPAPSVHAEEVAAFELEGGRHESQILDRHDPRPGPTARERLGVVISTCRCSAEAERGLDLRSHRAGGQLGEARLVAVRTQLVDPLGVVGAEAATDAVHLGEDEELRSAEPRRRGAPRPDPCRSLRRCRRGGSPAPRRGCRRRDGDHGDAGSDQRLDASSSRISSGFGEATTRRQPRPASSLSVHPRSRSSSLPRPRREGADRLGRVREGGTSSATRTRVSNTTAGARRPGAAPTRRARRSRPGFARPRRRGAAAAPRRRPLLRSSSLPTCGPFPCVSTTGPAWRIGSSAVNVSARFARCRPRFRARPCAAARSRRARRRSVRGRSSSPGGIPEPESASFRAAG